MAMYQIVQHFGDKNHKIAVLSQESIAGSVWKRLATCQTVREASIIVYEDAKARKRADTTEIDITLLI